MTREHCVQSSQTVQKLTLWRPLLPYGYRP